MGHLFPTCATFLDGIALLTNAVCDLATVIDSRDCGTEKLAKAGIRQDFQSTLDAPGRVPRIRFSALSPTDLAMGTQEKLEAAATRAAQEVHAGVVLLTAGSAVQLTGAYHEITAVKLAQQLNCPVVAVPAHCFSGDHLDGYSAALEALIQAMPITTQPVEPGTVGIIGMPFDRNEADEVANLRELERLLSGIGLRLVSVLPSGQRFDRFSRILNCEHLIGLPHGAAAAELLGRRLGRPVHMLPLPMGLEGTSKWLAQLAESTATQEDCRKFIEAERSRLCRTLRRPVRELFVGRHLVLAADPHLAVPLTAACTELGFRVLSVLLRSRNPALLEHAAGALRQHSPDTAVTWDQSLPAVAQQWAELAQSGVDLAIGTTAERAAATDLGLPFLELGFPSYVRHALFEAPWMGFQGTLWLADSLYNLLSAQRFLGR